MFQPHKKSHFRLFLLNTNLRFLLKQHFYILPLLKTKFRNENYLFYMAKPTVHINLQPLNLSPINPLLPHHPPHHRNLPTPTVPPQSPPQNHQHPRFQLQQQNKTPLPNIPIQHPQTMPNHLQRIPTLFNLSPNSPLHYRTGSTMTPK